MSVPHMDPVMWGVWYTAGFLAVLLAPGFLRTGSFLWAPGVQVAQHLGMAAAFLALALFLRTAAATPRGLSAATAILAGLCAFALAHLLLSFRSDLPQSRAVVLISAGLGTVLGVLPYLQRRLQIVGVGLLLAATAALAARIPAPKPPAPAERTITTALQQLSVTSFPGLVEPARVDGGGLTRYGDGFLLVTGDGVFYRLAWQGDKGLSAQRLDLATPLNMAEFTADHPQPSSAPRFRVTDLALDRSTSPAKLFVAHQHWNRELRCFTLRVSWIPVREGPPGTAPTWQSIFESRPCLAKTSSFDDLESGGRLAWDKQGQLLLTVGDHGFDGQTAPALAQKKDSDYGKVLRLERAGGRALVSLGHRNPQGLTVDDEGRIWLTEHGPQGGDELNLIDPGKNYGWPLATYGTAYGMNRWPLAPDKPNHGAFEEPAHAFVPSIAISNLIQVTSAQFPAWRGDLLVSSLRREGLFRVRLRGERVIYVEPIALNRRVRDLEQASDGRLLLWVDGSQLVALAATGYASKGEEAFGQCAWCHAPRGAGVASAPPLRAVVGRKVAAVGGYEYSPALAKMPGTWTRERLDAFLKDPEAFAPGTRMKFRGVQDPAERRLLIDYLSTGQ